MPLIDKTNDRILQLRVAVADTWFTRMLGLLGQQNSDPQTVIHIIPCKAVHTVGMQFPIDILALDKLGHVVQVVTGLNKNKVATLPYNTHSILEGGSGWVERNRLSTGLKIEIVADMKHRPGWDAMRHLFHWPLNIFIAILWSQLVWFLLQSWQHHQALITLGLLIHNTILLILFLLRRESSQTSNRLFDWLVPLATISCAMFLRPLTNNLGLLPNLSLLIQGVGVVAMLFSLISLGRSFGIVPAHRRLALSGAYKIVRHPLYTSEMVFYLGFFLGNLNLRNGLLVLFIYCGQIWRAAAEERLLQNDEKYFSYKQVVRYRFFPGLF